MNRHFAIKTSCSRVMKFHNNATITCASCVEAEHFNHKLFNPDLSGRFLAYTMKRIIALLLLFLVVACSKTTTNAPVNTSGSTATGINSDPLCLSTGIRNQPVTPVTAVIATTAADYSSGALAIVSGNSQGQFSSLNALDPTDSDISIAAYGQYFYRIGRAFAGNNITKFSINKPQTPIWQYSVNATTGSAVLSNPHDMVFASATKAYVLRYGTTKAWIVNPSTTTKTGFKTGELNLSAYGGIDGIPDMDSAVIADGKLFITLQRLEGPMLQPDNVSYLAVFDIKTDKEINVGIPGDTLKGIPLKVRNPTKILYDATTDEIYVQGSGSTLPPLKYVGGIEAINASTYTSKLILDDGDKNNHPYGLIYQMTLASPNILYFVGYDGWQNNTLYVMNIKTSKILKTRVAQLIGGDIGDITTDNQGRVWVGDNANAAIRIIDSGSCDQVAVVSTRLNPEKIVFTQ